MSKFAAFSLLLVLIGTPVLASAQDIDESTPTPTPMSSPASHRMHHKHTENGAMSQQSPSPAISGHYSSEEAAQSACTSGTVAWMNTKSHALHYSGDAYYGKTKHGEYVCVSK